MSLEDDLRQEIVDLTRENEKLQKELDLALQNVVRARTFLNDTIRMLI